MLHAFDSIANGLVSVLLVHVPFQRSVNAGLLIRLSNRWTPAHTEEAYLQAMYYHDPTFQREYDRAFSRADDLLYYRDMFNLVVQLAAVPYGRIFATFAPRLAARLGMAAATDMAAQGAASCSRRFNYASRSLLTDESGSYIPPSQRMPQRVQPWHSVPQPQRGGAWHSEGLSAGSEPPIDAPAPINPRQPRNFSTPQGGTDWERIALGTDRWEREHPGRPSPGDQFRNLQIALNRELRFPPGSRRVPIDQAEAEAIIAARQEPTSHYIPRERPPNANPIQSGLYEQYCRQFNGNPRDMPFGFKIVDPDGRTLYYVLNRAR